MLLVIGSCEVDGISFVVEEVKRKQDASATSSREIFGGLVPKVYEVPFSGLERAGVFLTSKHESPFDSGLFRTSYSAL